jgi:hypothetical protein
MNTAAAVIVSAVAVAALAGCTEPEPGSGRDTELGTVEQGLCMPDPFYGYVAVPATKTWSGLPSQVDFVVVDAHGQGKYTAYGVDVMNGRIDWARTVNSGSLGNFTDTMSLAGIGFILRPPPRPNPPGTELLYVAERERELLQLVDASYH